MIRYLLLFLLLNGFCTFGQTGESYHLNCLGLPKSSFLKYKSTFPDSASIIKEVDDIINKLYFLGYFYAEIKGVNWQQKTLNVDVQPGERFNYTYLKNGNIEPYILSEIKFREKFYQNQRFNLQDISKLQEQLLVWYENNGYPFAEVWLDSVKFTSTGIASLIFSDPGKQIHIDTIRMVGSAKISESYIGAHLGIKNKDFYNEHKIQLIDKRLDGLPFLKQVKKPEIIFTGDKAKINLFMDKENANQFDGLIGFLPNSTTGKLQLTGDFKLKLQNALNNAEIIDFNYRGLPEQSQELNLKFDYPYILRTQIGLKTDFSFFKRDTNFLNVNAKAGLVYSYDADKSLGFFVERFNGNTISSKNNLQLNATFGNITTQFYGLEGNLQRLDNAFIPLSGFKINVSVGAGSRKVKEELAEKKETKESKSSQFKIYADVNYYFKVSPKSVFFFHNLSSVLTGDELYENEVFRIGGFKTMRGFDEQSILAKSFTVQTIEYRYFVEQRSYLNVFYDQAVVDQLIGKTNNLTYPLGFGAGFTFQTKAGLISLSYAMGKQKNIPLDLQKGKIHFGIISYF